MLENKSANIQNTENLVITDEFQQALDILINQQKNVFIEGKAGTGKSTFISLLKQKIDNVVVVAPTGVAAMNIGGQTIHSFFKIKPGLVNLDNIKKKSPKVRQLYKNISILVIDEISMVRSDLFEAIDKFLKLNTENPTKPFGGIPICVIGDMKQLPPIVSKDEEEIFFSTYASPFFTDTESYRQADFTHITFNTIFRQKDKLFINLLNYIRNGNRHPKILQSINLRHTEIPQNKEIVTLTTTRAQAKRINENELEKIDSPIKSFTAATSGNFNEENEPAPKELQLKVGAYVMFVKNDVSFEGKNKNELNFRRWVNGTTGTVYAIDEHAIYVKVGNEIHNIEIEKWENIVYELNEETGKIKETISGTFYQYPLTLAWAITIHKSQGKTLDQAIIDLGRGTFAKGQLYVALSRCKTFDGIFLKRPIQAKDIF